MVINRESFLGFPWLVFKGGIDNNPRQLVPARYQPSIQSLIRRKVWEKNMEKRAEDVEKTSDLNEEWPFFSTAKCKPFGKLR